MRATCVGPATREMIFGHRSPLEQQAVGFVEEEDGYGAMENSAGAVCSDLIDLANGLAAFVDDLEELGHGLRFGGR